MKTVLVKTLVIAAALVGAVQARADIGWRIATNGYNNGVNYNGIQVNGMSNGLDSRQAPSPGRQIGTTAEVRKDPASLPSLRELASRSLAR